MRALVVCAHALMIAAIVIALASYLPGVRPGARTVQTIISEPECPMPAEGERLVLLIKRSEAGGLQFTCFITGGKS
jgi:hypothetical protein